MIDGQALALFESFIHGFKDAAYVAFASLAVIIFDHIITFQDELESFWTPPWSLARVLFLLNRYISIIIAVLQVYRLVALHPTKLGCRVSNAIWAFGIAFIVIIESVILLMRVLAVYRRHNWVKYGLLTLFFILTAGFIAFMIDLSIRTVPFDAVEPLVHGCPATMEATSLDVIWRVYVCPIILQTVLVAMIVYKAARQTNISKAGRGIVSLLARDGVMVYISVLFALILSIIACFVPTLQVPLLASNLLLPVVSISTSRILLNIRFHLTHALVAHLGHTFTGNGVLSGVEMSALYLGGYHGGIAPARGVEGAKVREIGNTTMIEVPVVDDLTLDDYYELDDERPQTQRSQHDLGVTVGAIEEGVSGHLKGETSSSTLGRTGSGHGHPRSRPGSARPALKISALGATPGWEHWDERLPTKDFHLPTLGVAHALRPPSPSVPPNTSANGSTTGIVSGTDSNSIESGSREDVREALSQVMVTKQIERTTSVSTSSGRRTTPTVSREKMIQWAPPPTASTIRSSTTAHSSGEGDEQTPTNPNHPHIQGAGPGRAGNGGGSSQGQGQAQHSRRERSNTRLRTSDRSTSRSVSRQQSREKHKSRPASTESESS